MVVNANGRPLCKHTRESQRPSSLSYGVGDIYCTWWCTYRTTTYWFILPFAALICTLVLLVPTSMMDGFQ